MGVLWQLIGFIFIFFIFFLVAVFVRSCKICAEDDRR